MKIVIWMLLKDLEKLVLTFDENENEDDYVNKFIFKYF